MQVVAVSPIVLLDSSHVETDLEEGDSSSVDTAAPNSNDLSSILNIYPVADYTSTCWQTHCKEHPIGKK